jgi:hypothetical protein
LLKKFTNLLTTYNFYLKPGRSLPSLKNLLSTVGFDEVVIVCCEFFDSGSSSVKPFRALQVLMFLYMAKWEEWVSFGAENGGGAFPQLEELYIFDCPKLNGGLPVHLPSLAKLQSEKCPQLVASLPRAPAIRELQLRYSNEVLFKELPTGMQKLKIQRWKILSASKVYLTPPLSISLYSFFNIM